MEARGLNGGGSSPTTPIKGALREDGQDDPTALALRMVLERLDSMERQRRLEAQAMNRRNAVLTAGLDKLYREIEESKRQSQEAIELLHQKMREVMEARRDPRTQKELEALAVKEAKEQMRQAQHRFQKALKEMPTGNITSYENKPVKLTVNGHSVVIRPGLNKDIPQTFIAAWERRKDNQKWAKEIEQALAPDTNGFRSINHYSDVLGKGPQWNVETGAV